jgi:plastocyanin
MSRTLDRHRTSRFLRVAAIGLVLPATLVACSSGDDMNRSSGMNGSSRPESSTSSPMKRGAGSDVQLELIAFKPAKLEVAAGTTVTWNQNDPGSHTVTSGTVEQGSGSVTGAPDGTFSSGELKTDETFEFAFAEPGVYPYFCEIHPATMRGEITVR